MTDKNSKKNSSSHYIAHEQDGCALKRMNFIVKASVNESDLIEDEIKSKK